MITAAEIRKKTERKYVDYLRSVVAGSEFEPIVIPCDKKASASMDEYQHELTDIRSQSKEVKGFGYTIEWKTVKTKAIKLEVVLPAEKTAGIYEWQVK